MGILTFLYSENQEWREKAKTYVLPNHWFGTERSEVQILSPRPFISIKYGRQPWRPYFVRDQFVYNLLRTYFPLELVGADVTHRGRQILMAHRLPLKQRKHK